MGIFSRRRARPRDEPAVRADLTPAFARSCDWQACRSEAVCAAAARVARALAAAPLHLYRNEALQHSDPLERLVRYSPGPGWNAYSFVFDLEFTRGTIGRAYALILRDHLQQPTALQYVDPARVTRLRARETGDIWNQVVLDDGKMGYVHDSDMLYLPFLTSTGMVTPAGVLAGSLDYDSQIKEFSLGALNGVHDVILISVPGNPGETKRREIINGILDGYKASGKAALVLDSGVTATRLASSPVDPKVLDVDKVTKSRVAGVYGMSSHLLGDGESSRTSSEEENQSFLSLTMVPVMGLWEAELDRKLLYWEKCADGFHFAFDAEALSRANTAVMAEKHFKGVRGGWIKPNEARKHDKLPPDPDGDRLMISRDLVPLDIPVNHPELLLQGGRQKTNGEGQDS